MGFATKALHVGKGPDPATGAIIVPIYQTSTFVQEDLGKHKGYEYARTSNPTRAACECNLAALENGHFGIAFASGMAAINAVMTMFKPGDHIVAGRNLYGGTLRPFQRLLKRTDLTFSHVDTTRLRQIEAAVRPATRLLYIETPSTPPDDRIWWHALLRGQFPRECPRPAHICPRLLARIKLRRSRNSHLPPRHHESYGRLGRIEAATRDHRRADSTLSVPRRRRGYHRRPRPGFGSSAVPVPVRPRHRPAWPRNELMPPG